MNISKLVASNVFCFEHLELSFKVPLLQIIGTNFDEKKSIDLIDTDYASGNGVGKTSIYHIITEAQYSKNILGIKKDFIKNIYTKAPFSIKIYYENGDVLHYTPTSCVLSDKSEKIIVKGRKEVSQYFEEKVPFQLYTWLTYMSPKIHLSYFTDSDKPKKEFLQYLFSDLNNYTKPLTTVQEKLKQIRKDLVEIQGKLSGYDNIYEEIEDDTEKEVVSTKTLEEYINNTKARINDLITREKKRDELLASNVTGFMEIPDTNELYEKLKSLEHTKKALEKIGKTGKCPVCGQNTEEMVKQLEQVTVEYEKLQKEYTVLKEEEKKAIANNEIYNKILALPESFKTTILEFKDKLKQAEEEFAEITEQNKIAISHNAKIKQIKEQQARITVLKQEAETQQKLLEEKRYIYEILEKVFSPSGLLSKKLPNRLNWLNYEVNSELAKLTNQFTLSFTMQNNKIVEKLYKNNKEYPVQNCSEGEYTRIMLALVMTLRKILKDLKGIDINFIFIDEIFGSLDTVGRQLLIQRMLESNWHSFIISHSHHDSSLPTLEIIKKNQVSKGVYNG